MSKKKPGFLTPKAIANRIKSKGLQRLRCYCQMCQKQCRDEVFHPYYIASFYFIHSMFIMLFFFNSGTNATQFPIRISVSCSCSERTPTSSWMSPSSTASTWARCGVASAPSASAPTSSTRSSLTTVTTCKLSHSISRYSLISIRSKLVNLRFNKPNNNALTTDTWTRRAGSRWPTTCIKQRRVLAMLLPMIRLNKQCHRT